MGMTIRDLAKACKVNASTVSRALRNDPRVKAETRDMILELARQHRYTPNITARNLAAGKTNTIWLVLGSLDNDIERVPARILSDLLREYGYDLLLILHNNSTAEFERIVGKLNQGITDGALIIPPGYKSGKIIRFIEQLPIPLVFIDRWLPGVKTPAITSSNALCSEKLTRFCIDCGADVYVVAFGNSNTVADIRQKTAIDCLDKLELEYCTEMDAEFLRRHPHKSVALLSSTGIKSVRVPHQGFYDELAKHTVYGGFFDSWTYEDKEFFTRAMVCIQDFNSIAQTAADTIIKLLSGEIKPESSIICADAEKFIEL